MPAHRSWAVDWERIKASLDAAEIGGAFFAGAPAEVKARIDALVPLRVEPGVGSYYRDDAGPASRAWKKFLFYSPDMKRVFGLKISCSGTCTGNGCGVSGCDVDQQGNCSECNCTGENCGAQCNCTKTSVWIPEENPE